MKPLTKAFANSSPRYVSPPLGSLNVQRTKKFIFNATERLKYRTSGPNVPIQ